MWRASDSGSLLCGVLGAAHPILANQKHPVTSVLDDVAWPARTKRLRLRPATLDDAEATWQIRRLESVSRWLTRAPHAFDIYRADFAEPASLKKSLVIELDTQVIGDLMVAVGDAWAQAEVADDAKRVQADLGWVIHPGFGGRGLATEAVREVLRICFEQLRLRRVTAECFSANEPSWRLMERLGMRRETHTVSESLHRSGVWLDGYGYALLAEEWQQQELRHETARADGSSCRAGRPPADVRAERGADIR